MLRLLVASFALLVSACAQVGAPSSNFAVGQFYEGSILYGGKQIPLPPGQWRGMAEITSSNNFGVSVGQIGLAQVDEAAKRVGHIVFIGGTTSATYASGGGFLSSDICKKPNAHKVVEVANFVGRRQDCWNISTTQVRNDPSPISLALRAEAARLGLELPPVLVSAFFRQADSRDALNLAYGFSPLEDGLRAPYGAWSVGEWSPSIVTQTAARRGYVDSKIKWAEEWRGRVIEAFRPLNN